MPGKYNLSQMTAEGNQTLRASGQSLIETCAAALSGLLVAAGAAVDQANDVTTEIAVPIRGEGANPTSLFEDLAIDLLTRIELDGGRFAPVELDGVIKTDEGLSVWGYLHGHATAAPSTMKLRLQETPVIETDDRGYVVGISLQFRVVSLKGRTNS